MRRVCEECPPEEAEQVAEEAVVRLSLDNLRTFPWIAEREAAGELALSGLHFGIADGVLRVAARTGPVRGAGLSRTGDASPHAAKRGRSRSDA